MRTWIASPWELEELFLPLRWSWVLFCLLLKSFCRVFIENSVFVHALRGHFIREQHSAVFTWYIGAYFIGKYAMQVLIVSLENSLKLVRCQGVQRREQNSWNLWCLSFRKCISTCFFLIWTGKAQLPYVWSFRSKILRFRQNSAVDLRNCSHEHI